MAMSVIEKVRIGTLGQLHKLLNRAVETPEAYEQLIRDLERALAELRGAHDEAEGNASGLQRQITEKKGEIAKKESGIDLLLGDDDPSNDEDALKLQLQVGQLNRELTELSALLEQAQSDRADLDNAIGQLENKHEEMLTGLRRLTLKSAASKAKDRASSAAEQALQASQAAGSVDNIAARIDANANRADARFGRVIGQLSSEDDPQRAVELAEAKAALAARRARIAEQAKGVSEPASA